MLGFLYSNFDIFYIAQDTIANPNILIKNRSYLAMSSKPVAQRQEMVFGTLALLSHLSIVAFQVSRAAAPKETKSCRTQGESVRPYDCNLTSIQMNARASQRLALPSKRLAWASQAHGGASKKLAEASHRVTGATHRLARALASRGLARASKRRARVSETLAKGVQEAY